MSKLCLMLCFSCLLLFSAVPVLSQEEAGREDLAKQDVSYLYSLQAPLTGESRVAMGENEATIFFRLNIRNISLSINKISYQVKESFEADETISQGAIGEDALLRKGVNEQIYSFTTPVQENSNYIFIFVETSIRNNTGTFRFDISLNNELNFPLTDLIVMEAEEDVPVFSNFIPQEIPFRIVSVYDDAPGAFIYYYSHNFEPNPPPMANRSNQVQKSLEIDSIFPVQLGETLSFDQEGLYFTQTDTTSLSGISFRIEEPYYPRFVSADKLIEPIRYISTSEEMEDLTNNDNEKLALDRYWIKATRSRERAKEVIRDYYRQVTKANILFTTYKEGWKTSQGMVYLLYGAPDQVYRSTGEEIWIYNEESNLMQDMSFTFVKVRNIFTNEHFNLVPDDSYSKFWYRNIDLWRKGRKQI